MSTKLMKALFDTKEYGIGDLNTRWAKHVTNGARLLADADNFTLVEVVGYAEDGAKTCQQLSKETNEAFLLTTIEEEYLTPIVAGYQETYSDFYNGAGEMVRLTRLETGVRFDTSSFTLNAGLTKDKVVKGCVAHFDVVTKKYIVSLKATPNAGFETASVKFDVVDEDSDFGYGLSIATIRLETK